MASRNSLGFGCAFFDVNLDGWLDFAVANGHIVIADRCANIRGNVGYAQPPQTFSQFGEGEFSRRSRQDCRRKIEQPKVDAAWSPETSIETAIWISLSQRTTVPPVSTGTINRRETAASASGW